jgi:hypothetical protein
LTAREAPVPVRVSMIEDTAANVVNTRPGWIGEWYGTKYRIRPRI